MKREDKPRLIEQGAGPRGPIGLSTAEDDAKRREKSEAFLAAHGIAEKAGIGNGLGHCKDALSPGDK